MNKIAKIALFTAMLFFTQVSFLSSETVILINSDNLIKFFGDLKKVSEVLQKRAEKIVPTDYDSQNDRQALIVNLERSKNFIKEGERLSIKIDYDTQKREKKRRQIVNIISDVLEIQKNVQIKLKELRAKK